MITDLQSNPVSGATSQAVEKFNEAQRAFGIYRGDPVALADEAVELAPDFTMALLLKAWLYVLATEPAAAAEAAAIVDRANGLTMNEREASHSAALRKLLAGDWTGAALAMDYHNARFPHDFLGVQAGHLMDFYRASARGLRDRIARVLPHWSPSIPGYSLLLGMQAFGLEESGDYAQAEAAGRQAVELEPFDCWAHHAIAHVMEMQGRAEDGIGWMIAREPFWSGEDNFFKVHNWWHRALYHLDLGQVEEVMRLCDGPVRGERSEVALDMVDASALLWRLHLSGHDPGERWTELARSWDQHADGRLYAFNDWHAVMAYLGAGRDDEVERVMAAMDANAGDNDNALWSREIGLPLSRGFVAFWREDYANAVELLFENRHIVNQFGGSHAQRDIIDWTMAEAAVRGAISGVAEALTNERIALKPHSAVNRALLGRARKATEARVT